MKSLPRVDLQSVVNFLIPFLLVSLLVDRSQCAPAVEGDDVDGGCYYMFNHYGEGDRILTNEPCLNCTCHNSMLMCYLRVCPFTKPIGQDCTIEKKPDQCCPVISCPQVPVSLVTPSALTSTTVPTTSVASVTGSTELATFERGCEIEGKNYPDGAQVIGDPSKPCELCYCIRNRTACVMQECILHVEGCEPVFQAGVCCPVRYQCDYPLQITDQSTVAGLITTTISSLFSSTPQPGGCSLDGEYYADGSQIPQAGPSPSPCEHCYCMRGEIVCAVQECGAPLENEGANCTAIPPGPGLCCPDKYTCESDGEINNDEPMTTLSSLGSVNETLENQTEAIPVSIEPFGSSAGDATKQMDESEKIESSTIGQDEVSIGIETKGTDSSSSTRHPEHDIINESSINETDIETHSRVSERPSIIPSSSSSSPDLEIENFEATTQKNFYEDIKTSEILSDDKKVVNLDNLSNNNMEQGILGLQVIAVTEMASELKTNAPEYVTVRPGVSASEMALLQDSTANTNESDTVSHELEGMVSHTENTLADEGVQLETSTEPSSGSYEKLIESATDKLSESSTENLLVTSEGSKSTEKPLSMDKEESSTDKLMVSSERPFEGSTENSIISTEKTSETSTENVISSTSNKLEVSSPSGLEYTTIKSTENYGLLSETTPEYSPEESVFEIPSNDKPVGGTDNNSPLQSSSTRPSVSDNASEVSFTTIMTPTEQLDYDQEKEDTNKTRITDQSQTTPGSNKDVNIPPKKYSDTTVAPAVESLESQSAATTQSVLSDQQVESEANNEKEVLDEPAAPSRPEGESGPQNTDDLEETTKMYKLPVEDETNMPIESGKTTSTTSSIIGEAQEASSPVPDSSEFPTTQKNVIVGDVSEDEKETLGNDDNHDGTESSVTEHGASSSPATTSEDNSEIKEIEKEGELEQNSSSLRPIEQDGYVMGVLTVSSTPEAPESLFLLTSSTLSPEVVPSSSSLSSILPSGSEADNEIGEDTDEKISADPVQSENLDIPSKPLSTNDLKEPSSSSPASVDETPSIAIEQDGNERTTESSSMGESNNQDHQNVEKNTELPQVSSIGENQNDPQISTQTPEGQIGMENVEKTTILSILQATEDTNSDKATDTSEKLADEGSASDLDKPTDSSVKPSGEVGFDMDNSTNAPVSTLSGNENVSDMDKNNDAPAKPAGEEIGSDMDKSTDTPVKLSGDESGVDKNADALPNLEGGESESDMEKSTDAPNLTSGDSVSELDKSTDAPAKLSGGESGSEMDKGFEAAIKLSGDGTETDVDKNEDAPVKLINEEDDSQKSTDAPVKLSESGSADMSTDAPVKLSESGSADMSTDAPVKLSGDESGPTDMDKSTDAPVKLSGDESGPTDMDKSTDAPVKLSGDESGSGMDKSTDAPVKLSGDESESGMDKSTNAPAKASGEESGSETLTGTEVPEKFSVEGNVPNLDKNFETTVKPLGGESDLDMIKTTEVPMNLAGEQSGSEMDKLSESSVPLADEGSVSDLGKPTVSPGESTDDGSVSDINKSTESPGPLAMEGNLSDQEKSTVSPGHSADSGMDKPAGVISSNLDLTTDSSVKLSGDESGSEMDKSTEAPEKLSGDGNSSEMDKPTEVPVKLSGDESGSDIDKNFDASVKPASEENGSDMDKDKPTGAPIKLAGEESELPMEKATNVPMKLSDAESGSAMDLEKPTNSPMKPSGEDSGVDGDNITDSSDKFADEGSTSDMDKATEYPVKLSVEQGRPEMDTATEVSVKLPVLDMDKSTDAPGKLSDEVSGLDMDKSTVAPVKMTDEETVLEVKPTEIPESLPGVTSESDTDKSTVTPINENASYLETTRTPVKIEVEENYSDSVTQTPMKTVELDSENNKETPVKPDVGQQDEPEHEKSPEDEVSVQNQIDLEKTTKQPFDLTGSVDEANIGKPTESPTHPISSGHQEQTTVGGFQIVSQDIPTSSVSSLSPAGAAINDAEKVTENPSGSDAVSQDETDISATELPSKPIRVQNQVQGEAATESYLQSETEKEQPGAEKFADASDKPSNVQLEMEKVSDAPLQSVDENNIKEKVSGGEEQGMHPDKTSSDDSATITPVVGDKESSGMQADQTTISGPAVYDERLTINTTTEPGKESQAFESLPGISEGAETTLAPGVSSINIQEQSLSEIQSQDKKETTPSPVVDGVTMPFEKEQPSTEPSESQNGAANDDHDHDEPENKLGVTDVPLSVSIPTSDFQGITTVSDEVSESQTTLRPKVINDNGHLDNSTQDADDSSTNTHSDGTGHEEDQNTGSSILDNKEPESMINDMKNYTEAQAGAEYTTMTPFDDSSRDPQAASTILPGSEDSSTYKPMDNSTHEMTNVEGTTETSELKPLGIAVISDMSETASEKLHDESPTDMTLVDSDATDSPARVPGEGNCFVEGKTYRNGSSIPPTTPCHIVCACQNSIVHCLLVHCPPPPSNFGDCKPIYRSGVCCPEYDCGGPEGSSVIVTPGPGQGFDKDEANFVTVTPETPSSETSEASQDEPFNLDSLNATDSVTTSRPISGSESVETSDSASLQSGEDNSSSVGSGILKPIRDSSSETSSDFEKSSQTPVSSTASGASLVSEQTSTRPLLSEEESVESANSPAEMSSERPSSIVTSSLSSIAEGLVEANKLEEALNITSDLESSSLSPGSYYPVTTTTSVTPSSAAWPYPTTTPASVMSTGACLFDGRVYMSAQQIPRDDPCDFCFCFRGDIICLQQSCPPPIPGCYEEPIPGFCCPRYECPVGNGNVTTQPPLFPPSYYHNQILNGVASGQNTGAIANMPSGPGCEIQGEYYESGQVITSTSGPCLECRCGATGMMECDPRECQPEPMLRKMIAAITSR